MTSHQQIIEKIQTLAGPTKYRTWYLNICQRAFSRAATRWRAKQLMGYVEGHHVLPISIDLTERRNPNNIAFLTAREHFVCHWLATKMFSGTQKAKMIYALSMFMNQNSFMQRGKCSRQYERVKFATSAAVLEIGPHNRGKTHSVETKAVLAAKQKGKKLSDTTKQKMSIKKRGTNNWMYGKQHSTKTRHMISQAVTGRQAHNKGIPMDPSIKNNMITTKRAKSNLYAVYRNNVFYGTMSIMTFCETYNYNYNSAYGSIKNKFAFFDWTFRLVNTTDGIHCAHSNPSVK